MSDIVILEADPDQVPRLRQCRALKTLDDVLPNDDQSREWRQVIAAFHSAGLQGAGQTIAVIDTGYDPKTRLLATAILQDKSVDLTTEGLADQHGHGTSVSLLVRACAPEAKLIHIKAFGKNGVCAGKNAADRESVFKQALAIARDQGATLINVSAGVHRSTHDHVDHGHNAGVCLCPICTLARQIVLEAGISIFASGGNHGRSDRFGGDDWWCPSNAPCVVPVFGFAAGQPIYDPWSVYPTGIGAAGKVRPGENSGWRLRRILQEIWHYLTESRPPWVGNSFATPMVTGTAALVRQVFALSGKNRPFQPKTPEPRQAYTFFEANGIRNELEILYSFKLQDFFRGFRGEREPADGLSTLANLEHEAIHLQNQGENAKAATLFQLAMNLSDIYQPGMKDLFTIHHHRAVARSLFVKNPLGAVQEWSRALHIASTHQGEPAWDKLIAAIKSEIDEAQLSGLADLWSEPMDFEI